MDKHFTKLLVIGDIHGCLDELKELLSSYYNPSEDFIVFVGDLVDRGPKSPDTVSYVRGLCLSGKAICLRGNHEEKYRKYKNHEDKKLEDPFYKNPVKFSMNKLVTYSVLSKDELDWLVNLPLSFYHLESNTLITHAGAMPYGDPLTQPPNVYIYSRYIDNTTKKMVQLDYNNFTKPKNSSHWSKFYSGKVNIIYGHNVHNRTNPHVTVTPAGIQTIGIDTGCCFGGCLTAVKFPVNDLTKKEFFKVKAKEEYFEYKELTEKM